MFSPILKEVYESNDIVTNILQCQYYNDDVLSRLLPFLLDETHVQTETDTHKLSVLKSMPDIFFLFADLIMDIPDLRNISDTTKNCMKINEWNPWKALSEECHNFSTFAHKKGSFNVIAQQLLFMWQKEESSPKYWSKRLGIIKESVNDFFLTYPILSYLLLSSSSTIVVGLLWDYTHIDKLSHISLEDPLNFDLVTRLPSFRTINFVFKDINDPEESFTYWHYNHLILEWFIINDLVGFDELGEEREEVITYIITNDKISLFKKIFFDIEFDDWIKGILTHECHKILDYVIKEKRKRIKKYVINNLTHHPFVNIARIILTYFPSYVQRYVGKIDTFKLAIDFSQLEWIITLGNIVDPVESMHPLLYAYKMNAKDIIPYLESKYEVKSEDLLYEAAKREFSSVVENILQRYKFSSEQLIKTLIYMLPHHNNKNIMKMIMDRMEPLPDVPLTISLKENL